jgi:uncharacterized membrane protein
MDTQEDVTRPEDVEHPPPPRRDVIAARSADWAATVWFLGANLLWWAAWLPTDGFGIDTSGQYNILTLLLSFEAIILTIAVLIQNRLDARARDRQIEADTQNNAIAAEATLRILKKLDSVQRTLRQHEQDHD